MQTCQHSDPKKRPYAYQIKHGVYNSQIRGYELDGIEQILENERKNPTKIIKSPDIGPITTYNPGAIYKSRPLSTMIKYAESTSRLKSQSIISDTGK